MILSYGYRAWFIDGKQYSEEEFNQYLLEKTTNEELVVYVKKNQKVRFVYKD